MNDGSFSVKCDLFDFDSIVGFWSGAKTNWDSYSDEQKQYLNEVCEGMNFDSLTQVNDFVWFDSEEVLKQGELLDELK